MKYDPRKHRSDLFRKRNRRGPVLPVSLVILVLIVALFALINPIQFVTTINPASVRVPPPTSSPTALPFPTSVNGGHIVFTCTRNNINQVCLINADGTGYKQLTNETTNTYYPAISPDGKTVVMAINKYDNFDIYLLILATSKMIQLTSNLGNSFSPDFSPDGKQILFVNRVGSGNSSLWLMGSMGENPHMLYAGPKDIVGAAWSPDGNSIAFAMEVDSAFTYEIFILDLENIQAPPCRLSHGLTGIGGALIGPTMAKTWSFLRARWKPGKSTALAWKPAKSPS